MMVEMKIDNKRFNKYARGRCPDKFMAMKNLCGLSKTQYNILVDKWCNKLTRWEIAEKNALAERTLDREYAESKIKILAIIDKYKQDGFAGEFFFKLDQELNGNDWSKHIKNKVDEDMKFDEEFGKWLLEDKKTNENDNLDHLAEYLGFKKPENK